MGHIWGWGHLLPLGGSVCWWNDYGGLNNEENIEKGKNNVGKEEQ